MNQSLDRLDVFAHVTRALAEAETLDGTLRRIVDLAVETVGGGEVGSVSLVRTGSSVETAAATDEICRKVDAAQYDAGEGPCLDAIWVDEMTLVNDLGTADRWPTFTPRALDLGVSAMLAFRLFVQDSTTGALNLFASRTGAFTDDSVRVGQVFAAHAAVAWDHARETMNLKAAIATRELIGQA